MDENNNLNTSSAPLESIINSENFSRLTEKNQKVVLTEIINANKKDGGFLGKFFGTNKENASLHIAFVICAILLLFCAIDILHAIKTNQPAYTELVKYILPIITLALGYIFGKGDK